VGWVSKKLMKKGTLGDSQEAGLREVYRTKEVEFNISGLRGPITCRHHYLILGTEQVESKDT